MPEHNLGVFLTRAQPPTNAHIDYVRHIATTSKVGLILVGSANKVGTLRNPFSGPLRINMMHEAVNELFPEANIMVCLLDDLTYENNLDPENFKRWGQYLYAAVVGHTGEHEFAYFTGESLQQVENWFGRHVETSITPVLLRSSALFGDLSATRVRQALADDNRSFVVANCPHSVARRYDQLRKLYLEVIAAPKTDFSALLT